MRDTALFTGLNGPQDEIKVGQIALRFLIDGPVSGASTTIFEMDVPSGAKVPIAHSHDAYDETIYGLEGVLSTTVNGESINVGPRESLFIPRGVIHKFDNILDTTARVLVVITPGILGSAYFREIAAVVKAAVGGPPDPAALVAVMLRHGLTPAR